MPLPLRTGPVLEAAWVGSGEKAGWVRGEQASGAVTDVDWNFQLAELVLHINREMLHHGAEIALLRDLYRWPLRRQGSLTVYFKIQVVIDAAEPAKLADFWAFALDYVLEPPPHGFETWEDFGRSIGMPEEEFGDQAAMIDPADEGPRVYFQRVPERKT